jgi:hypothetical protein
MSNHNTPNKNFDFEERSSMSKIPPRWFCNVCVYGAIIIEY